MNLSLRHILIGLSIMAAVPSTIALDLPIKRINGKDYYYYQVKRNESLLSIAEDLGVTREDILRNNPGASDGVRVGMKIYLPVSEFAESDKSKGGMSAGEQNLRYKVQKGETLFGIAYRFDITPEDIVALNPGANKGVKGGDILLLPVKGAGSIPAVAENVSSQAPVKTAEQVKEHTAEVPETVVEEEPREEVVATATESVAENENTEIIEVVEDTVQAEKANIAVLMPLMLNENNPDKHTRASNDFIRGFMLGMKSMSDQAGPVDLHIYDTQNSLERTLDILKGDELKDVDVVISPKEAGSMKQVLEATAESEAYVLNLFSAQDTTYLENPRSIKTYIPAMLMYEKAAQALIDMYEDYTPVFLIAKSGKTEKLPFTNYLRERFAEAEVQPIDLVFDSMLSSEDLLSLDRTGKYIFIPSSGSHAEFNKFARALVTLRDEFADPSSIGLFGYPDWTTFRGESAERLHQLGATIYSRFYEDEYSPETRKFISDFTEAYGVKPIEQVPSQALLGYDSARYLLTNLKANKGVFTPEESAAFKGLQSTFMFVTADEEVANDDIRTTGLVNQALYIIKFLPGEQVSVQVL